MSSKGSSGHAGVRGADGNVKRVETICSNLKNSVKTQIKGGVLIMRCARCISGCAIGKEEKEEGQN